jgi:hypothetical protein
MHVAGGTAAEVTAEVMGAAVAGARCMSAAVECIWAAGERISAAHLVSVLSAAADVTFGTVDGTPTGLAHVGSLLPAAMSGFADEERHPKARVDRPSFGDPNALELFVAQPA